jgi:hypothetical protein
MLTEPVDGWPPFRIAGLRFIDSSDGGFTVRLAVALDPESAAVIVETVLADTGEVLIVKVAVVLPLATVTDAGAVTALFEEVRITVAPLAPALALKVTVPVEVAPPKTEVGERVTLETFCAEQRAARQIRIKARKCFSIESIRNSRTTWAQMSL